MPSDFATLFASAANPILLMFGETVDYSSPTGSTVSDLKVIIDRNPGTVVVSEGGTENADRPATVYVKIADLAAPVFDGVFAASDGNFVVVRPPISESGYWRCETLVRHRTAINVHRTGGNA